LLKGLKMTKLEQIIRDDLGFIRHPNDITVLKKEIPELAHLSDSFVQEIYSDWSEWHYCAGWHILTDEIVEEFKAYLMKEAK